MSVSEWLGSATRRWIPALAVVALVAGVLLAQLGENLSGAADTPTHLVERGDFIISHFEAGEIRAAEDEKILSPRVRGQLQIVHLWPEGVRVELGDLLLQFDLSEHEKWVKDEIGLLESARADMEKAQASQAQKLAELKLRIEQRQATLDLAKISVQKAEYASSIEKEPRNISLNQSRRAVEEAKKNLAAREIVDRVEKQNIQLQINQAERRYDKVKKDYDRLSVYATKPGIVVYEKIRKRGTNRRGKVTKGDVVWGGTSLLSLPNLTAMQVHTQIGEMDIQRVSAGDVAFIRLEAFPGPVFHGVVSNVAPMAIELEDAPNVQIFEVTIDIEEQDDRLYPGMSASVEIVTEMYPGVLSIPLSAVADRNGQPIVFRVRDGTVEPVEVVLGKHNDVSVIVESGLQEGDTVAIRAPLT